MMVLNLKIQWKKRFLNLYSFVITLSLLLGIIGHVVFGLSVLILVPLPFIFGVLLSFTMYREIFLRPVFVNLSGDGIMLEMRLSNPKFINWNDLLGVGYEHLDWEKQPDNKNGIIIPRIGKKYWITYAIAHGIAVKYFSIKGKELPVEYIFERTEDFRARIQKG